jgi:hypothetical protein
VNGRPYCQRDVIVALISTTMKKVRGLWNVGNFERITIEKIQGIGKTQDLGFRVGGSNQIQWRTV